MSLRASVKQIAYNTVFGARDAFEAARGYPFRVCASSQSLAGGDAPDAPEMKVTEVEELIFDPRFNALYDRDGAIVRATALVRGQDGRPANAPDRLPEPFNMERLPAIDRTVWYGGPLFQGHFGHFMTESLARLWPAIEGMDSSVPAGVRSAPAAETWVFRRILNSARSKMPEADLSLYFPDMEILTPEAPVVLRRVLVPTPCQENGHYSHRYLKCVGGHLGGVLRKIDSPRFAPHAGGEGRFYLSRSRLPATKRKIIGERALESELRSRGFEIIYPERLSFSQQFDVISNSDVLVGPIGSAFHGIIGSLDHEMKIVYITDTMRNTYATIDSLYNVVSINSLSLEGLDYGHNLPVYPRLDLGMALQDIDGVLN